jgi:hypothetical protein
VSGVEIYANTVHLEKGLANCKSGFLNEKAMHNGFSGPEMVVLVQKRYDW